MTGRDGAGEGRGWQRKASLAGPADAAPPGAASGWRDGRPGRVQGVCWAARLLGAVFQHHRFSRLSVHHQALKPLHADAEEVVKHVPVAQEPLVAMPALQLWRGSRRAGGWVRNVARLQFHEDPAGPQTTTPSVRLHRYQRKMRILTVCLPALSLASTMTRPLLVCPGRLRTLRCQNGTVGR